VKPASAVQEEAPGWIVFLDQELLKKKAAAECAREMARLEGLRADWTRFSDRDRPLFNQWMAREFGSLLSDLREGERLFHEKMDLIQDIELVLILGEARTHRAAYKLVMERRAAEAAGFANHEDAEGGDPAHEAEDPDPVEQYREASRRGESEEELFNDFLETQLGVYAEELRKADYKRLFAKFKREVLGQEPPPSPPKNKRSGKGAVPAQGAPTESPGVSRLKSIYRQLVRRLHPDSRAEEREGVDAIWHEVQDAYAKGDLARLERLFAVTDAVSGTLDAGGAFSAMYDALRELRRSIRALLKSLAVAKKDPAWNFSRAGDHSSLQQRISMQLHSDRMEQLRRLERLGETLADWAPRKNVRRSRKRP
jgi:hypothetical protein